VSILRRASALVTHAGNNSVTEALAHGVPMLTLPFSTDQFDGAAAIEAARFGFAANPNRVTPLELAEAVRCLIGTPYPALDGLAVELALRPGAGIARAAVGEWLGRVAAVGTPRDGDEAGS
jgi:predicted glycosyltransferase